ncbi:MAG: ribose-phosphate pyrophosphokinase [Deltaproteobacteria bacterium]|jgi:ribose-phosphate pyrophosphokinase|nr:ribose-phosphate pyrophosphokinase [Deltaproteobacteria bacterium]MBW2535153.1 ribose-phosphate pyrophosphokinase [Deltaproteobacteria bacterium]
MDTIKLFTGSSNPTLAHKVAEELEISVGNADVTRFSDGEVNLSFNESIRSTDVFLLQSTSYPGNDHLMELLLMVDACRRASASRVNAVIPYFGYSRQDRQVRPRVPISAKVVANMLGAVGVDRVITIDIHAKQIQGFFDVPVDLLTAARLLIEHLRGLGLDDPVLVAPDAGGVELASDFALGLGGRMALIDYRRGSAAKAKAMRLIGDVSGADCILVDDMVDTGGTLTEAADLLVTSGARSVRAAVTHPVLSGTGVERLNRSKIQELITTDTIPLPVEKQIEKISVVSAAKVLAKAIGHVHTGQSLAEVR